VVAASRESEHQRSADRLSLPTIDGTEPLDLLRVSAIINPCAAHGRITSTLTKSAQIGHLNPGSISARKKISSRGFLSFLIPSHGTRMYLGLRICEVLRLSEWPRSRSIRLPQCFVLVDDEGARRALPRSIEETPLDDPGSDEEAGYLMPEPERDSEIIRRASLSLLRRGHRFSMTTTREDHNFDPGKP
jgi:hypothetical protein